MITLLSTRYSTLNYVVAATLLPLVFLIAFFFYPVARLMLLSVGDGTLVQYERAFFDGLYLAVLLNTGEIALWVSLICLVLGYPVAYFLANTRPFWAAIGFLVVMLPFWTSLLVRTYAWMVLLGHNGIINRVLQASGFIDEPIALLHNKIGVIIGMVHALLPYFIFSVYAVMKRIDRELMAAAAGLGAPQWLIFWRIYIPLTMPGVVAGFMLVFVLSLGFFITPALLGGGRVVMIATVIERLVRELLDWEFAAALCVILLALTLAIYAAVSQVLRGDTKWY